LRTTRLLSAQPGSLALLGAATLLTWSGEARVKIRVPGRVEASVQTAGSYITALSVPGDIGNIH